MFDLKGKVVLITGVTFYVDSGWLAA